MFEIVLGYLIGGGALFVAGGSMMMIVGFVLKGALG